MESEKQERRPAIEEHADLIAEFVAEVRTGERPERDRRLEAVDWAIRESAEEIRDYLEGVERWQLSYGVQLAVGTLTRKNGFTHDAPHVGHELTTAAERQRAARERLPALEERARPVVEPGTALPDTGGLTGEAQERLALRAHARRTSSNVAALSAAMATMD